MIKKILGVLILGVLVSSTVCLAYDTEVRLRPYAIFPGDDDTWDNAYGLEAKCIFWADPNFGIALSGGIEQWNVTDDIYADPGYAIKADGDAVMIPLGISALLRPLPSNSPFTLTLEGGLRYVVVNSDITITATDYEYIYEDEVDIDNGLIGLIGADLSIPIAPKASVGLGMGYQFDISKGDATWVGINIGENELEGFYINLGLDIKL